MNSLPPLLSPDREGALAKVQVNLPLPMLLENIDWVLETGLQPEIYFSGATLDQLDRKEVEQASSKLGRKSVSVTFHGPFMDLSPGAVDEKIREVTAGRFRQILEMVPLFHPRVIVLHAGYDRWRFDGDSALWLERSLLTWEPLIKEAEALQVKLALENTFEEDPSILHRLLQSVSSPALGCCLDPGHGHLFSRVPLAAWVECLGPQILEMHLHDNHQRTDEHLPLGQGGVDFDGLFSALQSQRIHPILTLEPHRAEDLCPSLEAVAKYLKH